MPAICCTETGASARAPCSHAAAQLRHLLRQPICAAYQARASTPTSRAGGREPVQEPAQLRLEGAAAAASVVGAVAAASLLALPAHAAADVAAVFERSCAGCHMGGGNVTQAGATLFIFDLQRNGVADPDALFDLIYRGKGKMPGWGVDCAPKGACTFGPRLSDDDVRAMARYVLDRAADGWR